MKKEETSRVFKLYMILLGCRPSGRHVEQHDFFFGIAPSLKELVPEIKSFWPDALESIHIDGWREVTRVDNYEIKIVLKENSELTSAVENPNALFFINLGGYQANQFEEKHYVMLSVNKDHAQAIKAAKQTLFFKTSTIRTTKGANAHIDDKFGIDVDDIYKIEEILSPGQKEKFQLEIALSSSPLPEDEIHLGYFKLDKLS